MTTALHEARFAAVAEVLRAAGAAAVLDLGCGEGAFLLELAREPWVERVLGLDVSASALATLAKALEALPERVQRKVELRCGSYTEPDPGLRGFDATVMVETIEHIHPDRLSLVERAVFAVLAPPLVVVTTPNADFNTLLGVPDHRRRHPDHRFEWGRERFRRWADGVARRNGYAVDYHDLGGSHPVLGGPSQMAVFRRRSGPLHQPDDDQEDHRTDGRVHDGREDAAAQREPHSRQDQAGDEGADDADDDVAQKAEAEARHDEPGEPAGDGAHDEKNEQTLDAQVMSSIARSFRGCRCRRSLGALGRAVHRLNGLVSATPRRARGG
jgi:small RNA 2'-O-methyltransferase